jgi:hypothetical protein
MIQKIQLFQIYLLLLLPGLASTSEANNNLHNKQESITFNCSVNPENDLYTLLHEFFKFIFTALDKDFSMIYQPDMRSKSELLAGNVDGHCGMSHISIQQLDNSRISEVSTVIGLLKIYAISSKRDENKYSNLNDLTSNSSIISVRGGSASLLLKNREITHLEVRTPEIAYKMLIGQRVDIFIINGIQLDQLKQKTNSLKELYTSPPLSELRIYPVLSHKSKHLLPELDYQLSKMVAQAGGPITTDSYENWKSAIESNLQ